MFSFGGAAPPGAAGTAQRPHRAVSREQLELEVFDVNSDFGYPPISDVDYDHPPPPVEDPAESGEEDEADGPETDEENEKLEEAPVEEALNEANLTHEQRQECRRMYRENGSLLPQVQAQLDQYRQEDRESREKLRPAREAALERSSAVRGLRALKQCHESSFRPEGAATVGPAKSRAGFGFGSTTNARAEAPPVSAEEMAALVNEIVDLDNQLDDQDNEHLERRRLEDMVRDLTDTVIELAKSQEGSGAARVRRAEEIVRQLDAAEERDNPWPIDGLQALESDVMEMIMEMAPDNRPDLKRKRDELLALHEIRVEQRSTALVIPARYFKALVQEIGQDFKNDLHFTPDSLMAMQYAAEDYLVEMFEDANLAAIHANRDWIQPNDIQFVRRMRRRVDINRW